MRPRRAGARVLAALVGADLGDEVVVRVEAHARPHEVAPLRAPGPDRHTLAPHPVDRAVVEEGLVALDVGAGVQRVARILDRSQQAVLVVFEARRLVLRVDHACGQPVRVVIGERGLVAAFVLGPRDGAVRVGPALAALVVGVGEEAEVALRVVLEQPVVVVGVGAGFVAVGIDLALELGDVLVRAPGLPLAGDVVAVDGEVVVLERRDLAALVALAGQVAVAVVVELDVAIARLDDLEDVPVARPLDSRPLSDRIGDRGDLALDVVAVLRGPRPRCDDGRHARGDVVARTCSSRSRGSLREASFHRSCPLPAPR